MRRYFKPEGHYIDVRSHGSLFSLGTQDDFVTQQGHESQKGLGSNLRLISCDLQSHEVMYLRNMSHECSVAPPLPQVEEILN